VIVRRAEEADRPLVLEMCRHYRATTTYSRILETLAPGASADNYDLIFTLLLAQPLDKAAVLVADHGGELVGMIAAMVGPLLIIGRDYAEELVWWVEPRYRNGTVGPRLLKAAEAWARSADLLCLKLGAPVSTEGAIVSAFYERSGYLPLETSHVKVL
jgi:GNAT superfamily N-acetyltransferase